ncbi:transposase [Nonomuraea sp. NPDC050153]|uniref:transposase n=1 Tax=Nonomuraea sp. NPDC050153 TaxID=3364359 RepID=UPI003789D061
MVGVFLGYVSTGGRAVLDRELYLPRESWIASPEHRAAARVPEQVGFATKPQLLRAMIERALAAGMLFGWVTAHEAYGHKCVLVRANGSGCAACPDI